MISLKKAVFTFCVGLGLAASMITSVSALPSCSTCDYWQTQCDNGVVSFCAKLRYCTGCP